MTKQLKSTHPAYKAFEELCSHAEKLGITIEFFGTRTIMTHNGREIFIEDIEDGCAIAEFPPSFEVKLTTELD